MLDSLLQRFRRVWNSPRHDQPTQVSAALKALTIDESALARDLVTEELRAAEATFWTRWEEDGDLGGCFEALTRWHGWRTALAELETPDTRDDRRFTVDSLVLRDCYQVLFADPSTESVVYLTGFAAESTGRTLHRCIELDHRTQSRVRAEVDPEADFAALLDLETNGHLLLGHCHNQPGSGRTSTTPSQTDRRYQRFLEANGYDAIGVIMTKDGYVRFFSNSLDFTIEVYGNHVRKEPSDPNVFRLDEPLRRARTIDANA